MTGTRIPIAIWRKSPNSSLNLSPGDLELIKRALESSCNRSTRSCSESPPSKKFGVIMSSKIPVRITPESDNKRPYISDGHLIIRQITGFFQCATFDNSSNDNNNNGPRTSSPISPRMEVPLSFSMTKLKVDAVYYDDLLRNELLREEKYAHLFVNDKDLNVNLVLRRTILDWIIAAAEYFHYSVNTIHVAVFLMDVFLHHRNVRPIAWPLMGVTAFHLAGKMEEPLRVKLSKICHTYKIFGTCSREEVAWMEVQILQSVGFFMMPPTTKTFVDLAFQSGKIGFPCRLTERAVKLLTDDIIRRTLQSFEMSRVKSSKKAEFAIKIATEYVMLHRNAFLIHAQCRRIPAEERSIVQNAPSHCFELLNYFLLSVKSQ